MHACIGTFGWYWDVLEASSNLGKKERLLLTDGFLCGMDSLQYGFWRLVFQGERALVSTYQACDLRHFTYPPSALRFPHVGVRVK